MNNRIRYHLDENIDPDIALALRIQGIDVTTTFEINMAGKSDQEQLAFVCQEKRILITHDTDFLKMAHKNNKHYGIIFCKKASLSMGEIIRGLILIYEVMSPDEMEGNIEYL